MTCGDMTRLSNIYIRNTIMYRGDTVPPDRKEVMAMRLDKTLHGRLKRSAERKGLALSALIRMWLIERLEQDEADEKHKKAAR